MQLASPSSQWSVCGEEFSEVSGSHAVQTVMGVKEDFKLNSEMDREPVQGVKDEGDVIVFTHPHQNPGRAILNALELLKGLARDPDEECITVVQPGEDKGMDELLSCRMGEGWLELGYIIRGQKRKF